MGSFRLSHTAILGAVILLFYGGFLVLWLGGFHAFNMAWTDLWGVYLVVTDDPAAPPIPFFDLHGVLSWRDCHLLGLDVMAANPCDPAGRPSNYSPLWYLLPTGGRDIHLLLGFLLTGTFLALLPPLLRPASGSELAIAALAAISSATLFAVERANVDILMFLMALAAVWLWRSGRGWPAYGVMLAAAALKFYPLALLGMAVREPARRLAAVAAASSILVVIFGLIFWDELERVSHMMPVPIWYGDNFGASLLGVFAADELGLPPFAVTLLTLLLTGLVLWQGWRIAAQLAPVLEPAFWTGREGALMLAGALVTAGCFLMTANIVYRAIFLLMTLPGFFLLARTIGRPARLAGWGLFAILFCLYSEFLRRLLRLVRDALLPPDQAGLGDNIPEVTFFLMREAVWWWLMALLAGLLLAFLRQAPVVAMLRRRDRPA